MTATVQGVGGKARTPRARAPAILAIALLLLAVGTSLVSRAPPVSITVPYSSTPVGDPDLDGNPATGAWSDALATAIPLENAEAAPYGSATLYAKHDNVNLFLRLDGSIDVPWTSAASNRFWVGFIVSPTGTTHHGGGTWDGSFFGLWDGTDYAPQPTYPPRVVDTTGFDRPPIADGNQDAVGFMRYSGAAAPYGFTAEWRRPLNSGDAEDLTYTADGVATYNFFATSDSDGGGSQGGNIRHKQVTNLNTLKLAPMTAPNTAPTIDLTTPNGGEAWTGGTPHTIRWNMSDAETAVASLSVWLNYSLNNGASYSPIAGAQGLTGLTCPCTYAWTTPAADSTTALVRATVVDGGGLSGTDASSAAFAIDSTRPTVTGTVPMNGATGVPTTTTVQVTFSEPMNRGSAELAFSLQRMDTMAYVGGTSSWAGATLTFTPSAALAQAVTFTGRVNASALDASDPGNGMASLYTFSFATVDASPPTITSAAIPALQESGGPVNITATAMDNVGVTGVWTEVRDPGGALLGNFTMAWDGSGYSYAAVYRTTGTYTFRAVARDAAGNWAEDTGTFVVRDTTPPSITHAPPAGAAVGIPIPLQASVVDNDAVAQVRVNYTDVLGATTNATMTPSGPFYVVTIPGQPAAGTVTYFVWAADPSGNAARTVLYSVTVFASDVTPPTIAAVTANPPVQDVPGPVNVTADVTDNVAVATVYLDVTDPLGAPVGNFSMARVGLSDTFSVERPYLVLGAYSLVVWAADTSGNVASATGGFSVVDRIAPTVVSTSAAPDPQQVGLPVDFAAQVTDNGPIDRVTIDIADPLGTPLGNFTMTLVGGNYTYASSFAAIGVHTFVVWAVDLGGNAASAGGQFTIRDVDSTPPTISAVVANPPVQDVPGPVNVTADVTDNVAVATVYLDVTDPLGAPVGNFSMARVGATSAYFLERPYTVLGTHSFAIWATDTTGNVASAGGGFAVVDRVLPAIVAASAAPDPQEIGLSVAFAARVTDNDRVDLVTVRIADPGGALLGNFTMTLTGSDYRYARPFGGVGVHTYAVWATDPSGNAATSSGTFTVEDVRPPIVSATGAGTYEVGTVVTFDASASADNWGIANYTWVFDYDGAPISLFGAVVTWTFGILGTYDVNVTVTDLAGLRASATLAVIVVHDAPPMPSIDAVTPTVPGCLRVTWTPLADPTVTTYRLFRWNATEAAFLLLAEATPANASFDDCGLEYDAVYTYRMTVLDDTGFESAPSPMVNGRTTAPPPAAAIELPLVLAVVLLSAFAAVLAIALFAERRKRKGEKEPAPVTEDLPPK